MSKIPRGIKNHNPGNIRISSTNWQGEVPGEDEVFETYASPVFGLRAIGVLFLNYQKRYGLKTIRDLINRYAPPSENDTDAYVTLVAGRVGVFPDTPIVVADHLRSLLPAIVRQEVGKPMDRADWYDDATYDEATSMALKAVG